MKNTNIRKKITLMFGSAGFSVVARLVILAAGTLAPLEPIHAQTLPAFENSPIGFASLNAMGQNGTTGGEGGQTVTVSTASALQSAVSQSGPLIVQVSGAIALSGDVSLASNKTIIGLGSTAAITGAGLIISGVQNVIVRNIAFSNASVNSITIEVNAHHVWVDHCSFTNAADTLVDIKRQANYITVSWNVFTNTLETILQGHSDTFTQDIGFLKVTYHHNWFDGTTERHPRVRFSEPTHVFNNYYLNLGKYGVASTMNAGVLVEGNYFDNVPQPTLTDISGSAAPGRLVERNNIFVSSGAPQSAGTVIEPSTFYSYQLDPTSEIPSIVTSGAGVGKINTAEPDFSISASPAALTVTPGTQSPSTLTISCLDGLAGSVSFSASSVPTGVQVSFSPSSVNCPGGGTATANISVQNGTSAGTSSITITGIDGSIAHAATVILTIPGSGFSLSPSASTVSLAQGGSATDTITITPSGGFTGSVTLAASGLPSGVTATFGTNTTTSTSVLTLAASSTAMTGPATVTITGTSGTTTATTTIALNVNPAVPGNVTITPVVSSNSPFFVEEDVKLANTAPVTALSITIIVAKTTGMGINGEYNTVGGIITQGDSTTSSTLTYTFALNAGQTLSAGSYIFAAQMSGTGTAHPTSGDTFSVTYTAGGTTKTQAGHF